MNPQEPYQPVPPPETPTPPQPNPAPLQPLPPQPPVPPPIDQNEVLPAPAPDPYASPQPSLESPPPPQKPKKRWLKPVIIALLVLVVLALAAVGYAFYRSTQTPSRADKPNVIFVLTDDESLNLMQFMPNTNSLIKDQGATFSNYFDNISLCCPARTSIMRGQYAHNTGVEDNAGTNGGFSAFFTKGLQNSNVATWMQSAGYTTTLMGKYLNNYPTDEKTGKKADDAPFLPGVSYTYVPPGWNDWFVPAKGGPYGEYNYTMNDNGKLVDYGKTPSDYMVDVISNRADQFIKDNASKPYFMYLATYAPHSPYTPAPRYDGTKDSLTYPKDSSYNEADVSDKPSFIADKSTLTAKQQDTIQTAYQKRAEAVQGVDDLVKNLYETLKSTGQLDNTYIVFTSDNGYHMGEHLLSPGKNTPYETDVHLPLYVRGPGIKAGTKSDALVGNIDLAPTFGAIAGAQVPSFVDGVSLLPSLTGKGTAQTRDYYLLERTPSDFMGSSDTTTTNEPEDQQLPGRQDKAPPGFQGVRSKNGFTYVEYSDGEKEFYNLNNDPTELNNLLSKTAKPLSATDQAQLVLMQNALTKLRTCKMSSCLVQ